MNAPVTIVTPTMPKREPLLLSRSIPSIRSQDYDGVIQHVIVSDRNPGLAERIAEHHEPDPMHPIQVVEINDTWINEYTKRCTGSFPWRFGGFLAHGDYVGFLGDDDEYLPEHIKVSVTTMEQTGADFTLTRVAFYGDGNFAFEIGDHTFALGHLDATGIMCRRQALVISNWDIPGLDEPDANAGDFRMVRAWKKAGLRGEFINQTTGKHHDGWINNYKNDRA